MFAMLSQSTGLVERTISTSTSSVIPPRLMNLEQAIEIINDDELVEVTPHNLRMRKGVLAANMRPRRET